MLLPYNPECHVIDFTKFRRMDVLEKVLASGRSEIYLKVSEEGQVGAGDTIEQIVKDPNQVISDIVRVYAKDREDIKTMQRSQRRDLARRMETLFSGTHKTDRKKPG